LRRLGGVDAGTRFRSAAVWGCAAFDSVAVVVKCHAVSVRLRRLVDLAEKSRDVLAAR